MTFFYIYQKAYLIMHLSQPQTCIVESQLQTCIVESHLQTCIVESQH